jgi:hypothetical protein
MESLQSKTAKLLGYTIAHGYITAITGAEYSVVLAPDGSYVNGSAFLLHNKKVANPYDCESVAYHLSLFYGITASQDS